VTWEKKKVLVTVKAYPEQSTKHGTVVCTAGIADTGDWIRLYPMPYNAFLGPGKIQRYDWIEVECERVTTEKLSRKESYRVRDGSVKIIDLSLSQEKIRGRVPWEKRNEIILPKVVPSLEFLKNQYAEDGTSLGLVRPQEIKRFYTRGDLAQPPEPRGYQESLDGQKIPIISNIPHIFAYTFRCAGCSEGQEHDIMCEDWELFESYRSGGRTIPM